MKHVKTLSTRNLQHTVKNGGCGECQTSCQSACKTSCTVGNQTCEKKWLQKGATNCGPLLIHPQCFYREFFNSANFYRGIFHIKKFRYGRKWHPQFSLPPKQYHQHKKLLIVHVLLLFEDLQIQLLFGYPLA